MKKVNLGFALAMIIMVIFYLLKYIINQDINRIILSLMIIILIAVAFQFNKFIKFNIPEKIRFAYLLFIFLTTIVGSLINLYRLVNGYDKFMHFTSGIIATYIAYKIFVRFFTLKKDSLIFFNLFLISFSSFIALIWEVIEYVTDLILKSDAQHFYTTGLNDTMQDLIVTIIGSVIFIVIYDHKKKRYLN